MPETPNKQYSPEEVREVGKQVIGNDYIQFLLQKHLEDLVRAYIRKYVWIGGVAVTLLCVGFGLQAWQTWDVFGRAQQTVKNMEDDLKTQVASAKEMVLNLREQVQGIRVDADSVDRVRDEMKEAQAELSKTKDASSNMIAKLEESSRYASTMQNQFLTQLASASGSAQSSLGEVQTLLRAARTDVAMQQQNINELSADLANSRRELDMRQQALDSRTTELLQTSERLRSLEQLSNTLRSVQASSLVLLRESKPYALQLPDASVRANRDGVVPLVPFRFMATGVGRDTLKITYTADGERAEWTISNARDGQSACTRLGQTGFEATIEQLYWGFFSPELVLLRVAPGNSAKPCSRAVQRTS